MNEDAVEEFWIAKVCLFLCYALLLSADSSKRHA
jgi:hypothetical protein